MSSRLVQDRPESLCEPVLSGHTHKTNQDEVLLRSWRRTAPDAFTVTARWPVTHPFYLNRHGRRDPLLLCETVRQTLPLLSHRAYEVPLGHQLLWQEFSWDIDPVASYADYDPVALDLHITCDNVKYRRGRAAAISLTVDVERDGRPMATARSRFAIQDRAVYNRLRGRYADAAAATARALPLPPPASPLPLGRDSVKDVVLAATDQPGCWQLRVDTTHPVLFDHLVDHTPGMLLLEAARQAAVASAHPRPMIITGMDSVFTRYAELDSPCWLRAEPLADPQRIRVTAQQHGEEIFSSVGSLAPVALARAS